MTSVDFPPIPEDQFELYADVSTFPSIFSPLRGPQLYAKDGRGDELETYLEALVSLTKSEPGTLEYAIARDDQNPNHFHVFERYTGKAAFEKHIAAKEFVDFIESGVLAKPPNPKMLKALKGL
jgi:quinol monooxygenase YgiN